MNLEALVRGDATAVLGACRLESGNADSFGAEAIADAFRRAPLGEPAKLVEAAAHLALFTDGEAVFADRYGDHIGRLWRVGQADPGTPEPAVAVAFDPDLRQARGAVFFAASDHPDLAADAAVRVDAAARMVAADDGAFRTRVFVTRAFGTHAQGAALFAVHALAAGPVRTPSLSLAAAYWDGPNVQLVRDPPATRTLHVRIVG